MKKNSVLKKKHFKNRIIISVVARTESRRLPKKALLKINNQTFDRTFIGKVKSLQRKKRIIAGVQLKEKMMTRLLKSVKNIRLNILEVQMKMF